MPDAKSNQRTKWTVVIATASGLHTCVLGADEIPAELAILCEQGKAAAFYNHPSGKVVQMIDAKGNSKVLSDFTFDQLVYEIRHLNKAKWTPKLTDGVQDEK